MTPQTFSNAMVATVGAYAEIVAEQARVIEQLQAALRQQPKGLRPAPGSPAQAVIDAARAVVVFDESGAPRGALDREFGQLRLALAAFDRAGETGT